MTTPEQSQGPAVFPHGEPSIELTSAYLQHAWGQVLANLRVAGNHPAVVEHHASVGEGFVWALSAAELITDEQRNTMTERLRLARDQSMRRLEVGQ
jgi:hypothetical protein